MTEELNGMDASAAAGILEPSANEEPAASEPETSPVPEPQPEPEPDKNPKPQPAVPTNVSASVDAPAAKIPLSGQSGNADLSATIEQAARENGIPSGILHAQANKESHTKTGQTSSKGAEGVMQIMPKTAASLGVDPNDPHANIHGGAKYLKQLHDRFGSWDKALAAYNWGPTNLHAAISKHGESWLAATPKETQNYVHEILTHPVIGPVQTKSHGVSGSWEPEEPSLPEKIWQGVKDWVTPAKTPDGPTSEEKNTPSGIFAGVPGAIMIKPPIAAAQSMLHMVPGAILVRPAPQPPRTENTSPQEAPNAATGQSGAQSVITPPNPPAIHQTQEQQPEWQNENVAHHMASAWKESGAGKTGDESSFLITKDHPNVPIPLPMTHNYHKETFSLVPDTTAIYHTHPDNSDPEPSAADRKIADDHHIKMYVMSSKGLSLYDPATKKVTWVAEGLNYLPENADSPQAAQAQKQVAAATDALDPNSAKKKDAEQAMKTAWAATKVPE